MQITNAVLALYLTQLPLFIAFAAGIVVSLSYRRRYPQAAGLALVASIMLLLVLTISPVTALMPLMMGGRGFPVSQTGLAMSAIGVTRSFLTAVAFALLLVAVFVGRGDQRKQQFR